MLKIKKERHDEMEYEICIDILRELLNGDNNYTIFDIKDILELEIFNSRLKSITIKEIYDYDYNNKRRNTTLKINKKKIIKTNNNENIKKIIESLILLLMDYNIEYRFNTIKQYIYNNIIVDNVSDRVLIELLKKLKKKGYIIYKQSTNKSHCGFWIKIYDSKDTVFK